MKIYLLQAHGPRKMWNSIGAPLGSTAFRSPERAEAAKPKFIQNCITPRDEDDFGVLSRVDKVNVLDLELEDE